MHLCMPKEISLIKQKILLLLLAGISLSLARTSGRQWKIVKAAAREWKRMNKEKLREDIKQLYKTKLLSSKENADGSLTFELTRKGKLKALTFTFENMKIERKNWDKKWRLVIFDIPEKLRRGRDALRAKLRQLGFYELQKSAFVFPYQCEDELDFVIEFFDLRKFVRVAILESIDNEIHLKEYFHL